MTDLISNPIFAIMLSIFFYMFGKALYEKTKFPLFNPLLFATVLLMLFIYIGGLDIHLFKNDLDAVQLFLGPLIVSLAVTIMRNSTIIRTNILAIFGGALIGSLVSVFSILLLGKWFALNPEMIASMIPKSVTTPIAIEISERLGGIREITVAAVILTGITGAIVGPILAKIFKFKNPNILGMAFGTASHAVGTAKAVELEENAGAVGGIAIVAAGLMTVLISLFL